MILIYNIGIQLYTWAIHIAAFFNPKAKSWVNGRKNIFNRLAQDVSNYQLTNTAKTIWIHVASLGEFEQGRPVIEALKRQDNPPFIILTFFSPSGYEVRKDYPLVDAVYYLPVDTAENAHKFISLIKPHLVIFVKYEFWYHYLHELKKRNIPTILISAIFTPKQLSLSNLYSILLKKMLHSFTHIFVQNALSVSLLSDIGFHNVTLAGDTRVDRVMALVQDAPEFPFIKKFVANSPVLVGGSTWHEDEKIILSLFNNPHFNQYKFIIAPHDISIKNVERLCSQLPPSYIKYSEWLKNSENTEGGDIETRILVIDNVGMLSALYRYGKIAYIGGGFGSGIHNTLEPIAWGLPVIFGPKYQKFEEAVRLIEIGGGFCVHNPEECQHIMLDLNSQQNLAFASQAALSYIHNNQGATSIIIKSIPIYLSN